MIYYLESLLCVYYYHYHYLTVIANYLLLVYYRIIPFPLYSNIFIEYIPLFFKLHLYASIIFSVGSLIMIEETLLHQLRRYEDSYA